MLKDTERIAKHIKFPVDLVHRIEEYRERHGIKTFAQTLYILVRLGLERDSE